MLPRVLSIVLCIASAIGAAFTSRAEPGQGQAAAGKQERDKEVTIQIGTDSNLEKATALREVVRRLGEARVSEVRADTGEKLYRILLGRFASPVEAEKFVDDHGLRKLFPELWINPYKIEAVEYRKPTPAGPQELQINLFCENGRKYGEYRTKGDAEVLVKWDCTPGYIYEGADSQSSPKESAYSLAPMVGLSTLSTGSASITGTTYGFELKSHTALGSAAVGVVELRMLGRTYMNQFAVSPGTFNLETRALAGARFSVLPRTELEPVFGLLNNRFMISTAGDPPAFETHWLPVLGLRAVQTVYHTYRAFTIQFAAGYHQIAGKTTDTGTVLTGSLITAGVHARRWITLDISADWFFDWNYQLQKGGSISQKEMTFLTGFSFVWTP